jgi:hypothetical protein
MKKIFIFLKIIFQVFEAIQQGIPRATGIEINRVLVYYARLKAYSSGQNKICQFKRANLWKVKIQNILLLINVFFCLA